MDRSPMVRISRCTRFRPTTIPCRSSQTIMRRDPKKGVSRYCQSMACIRARSSSEVPRDR